MRRQIIFAAILIIAILAALAYFLPRPVGPADNPGAGVNAGPAATQQNGAGTTNSKEIAGQDREAPQK